jgi:hypothetical protein
MKRLIPRNPRGLRNLRYCEILVVNRHAMSATASVYNTVGLNDCPDAQWKSLDAEKLKKELKAGEVATFDGMQMRQLTTLEMKGGNKREPYTENIVDRESLANPGGKLKLPKGWTYSVRKPATDYILSNSGAKAHVLQDDLKNSYQLVQ